MSPSVNRSSDSPQSSGETLPELSSVQNQHPETPTDNSETMTESAVAADSTEATPSSDIQRQQPIPPPSEPMQYRAIGLVRGQYMPSADQLTRGTLLAADGTLIDAVLLGRVMSLVKNHLDLSQPHLWVVYPRTRQENDSNLHVQIVGVWEPETLSQATLAEVPDSGEASDQSTEVEQSSDLSEIDGLQILVDGYFSIRGQVIYQSRETGQVIVKIKQSPRKQEDKTKFFKLKLQGFLGEKVINHFWDLHVQLKANTLQIHEGNDIGLVSIKPRKKPFNKRGRRPDGRSDGRSDGRRNVSNQRPPRKGERPGERPPAATPPKRREPLPKPVKRNEQHGGGSTSGNPA